MPYSWTPAEVLALNGIQPQNVINQKIKCPVCGNSNAYYNTQNGTWHCFKGSCNESGDSRSFHAIMNNISLRDAGKDIERRLGIDSSSKNERPARIVKKADTIVQSDIAPAEVLDDTYRAFLNELPLIQKHKDNLLARGFSLEKIADIKDGSMPGKDEMDLTAICKRLQVDGHRLNGVPGFFELKDGKWTFVYRTKGIIMPRVNCKNQITGLQIRKDDDLRTYIQTSDGNEELESKCTWFSSKGLKGGCGAYTAIHYACDFIYNKSEHVYKPVIPGKIVMLTEGIMKGDLVNQLQPNVPVLANQGVNCLNDLKDELMWLKKTANLEAVIMGYDMDYKTNPNVEKPLKKAKEIISECGLQIKELDWETDMTVNGKSFQLKGIDDYLAYYKLGITPVIK